MEVAVFVVYIKSWWLFVKSNHLRQYFRLLLGNKGTELTCDHNFPFFVEQKRVYLYYVSSLNWNIILGGYFTKEIRLFLDLYTQFNKHFWECGRSLNSCGHSCPLIFLARFFSHTNTCISCNNCLSVENCAHRTKER